MSINEDGQDAKLRSFRSDEISGEKTFEPMRVGRLARETGVSVRALHYYDEIGLLVPSLRTGGKHRLYAREEIVRLQQIVSLRRLGLTLEEIGACLDRPGFSPQEVLRLHAQRLREQIERQQRLCERLEAVAVWLGGTEEVSAEEFIQLIEVMTMNEKYFTPEQQAEIEERAKALGPEGLKKSQEDWATLMDEVQAAMDRGEDPASEHAQSLAARWTELVRGFTGGNPGISKSLEKMYQNETEIHGMQTGPVREMGEFIRKASEEGKKGS